MNTIVYLIRHSAKLKNDYIEEYNSSQSNTIRDEKIILSSEGEKRAEILSNEKELQNLDAIYASNCVRTLQTAKYIMEKQNLKVNIDERFDERRVGKPNDGTIKDWFTRQHIDENFRTEGGESQKDVRERFSKAFYEVIEKNKGKRVAIFSHGYAITFFLLKWCKLLAIDETRKRKISFNNNIVLNKRLNAPEVFKLEINENNELISIQNIEFDDLPNKDDMGK